MDPQAVLALCHEHAEAEAEAEAEFDIDRVLATLVPAPGGVRVLPPGQGAHGRGRHRTVLSPPVPGVRLPGDGLQASR
jgi:hypothetical protein